jgi:hypothetical protein
MALMCSVKTGMSVFAVLVHGRVVLLDLKHVVYIEDRSGSPGLGLTMKKSTEDRAYMPITPGAYETIGDHPG